ncbi:FHA domain-containing protein [Myxococcota bacterium]|nr:FHA domain-containing protein [Myxococcota bacterium]
MKLVLSHPGIGELTAHVDERGLVVGRQGGSANLEMNWDGRVSRRHARFWLADGQLWLEDLGSRNGTWLETERIEHPIRIEPGMRVAIGETWFWLAPEEAIPAHEQPSQGPLEIVIEDELEHAIKAYEPETEDVTNTTEMPAMKRPAAPVRSLPVPQLASDTEVVLRSDRESLSAVWIDSLSKGALFVPTDHPPPSRAHLTLRLETPGGSLELHAEVVHMVDSASAQAMGTSPGIGLHITDLTPENRAAIHRFATGQTNRLEVHKPGPSARQLAREADPIEPVLARAREFISRVEANDLYTALALKPNAPDADIRKRIAELKASFTSAQTNATPPQVTRLAGAVRLLERAAITLGDPIRRLEYDFRRGDVRAEERILRANDGSGPGLVQLRQAWSRSFPGEVDSAAALAKKAAAAKRTRETLAAIETLRAAIRLDPFNTELRETAKAWEALLPRKSS